VSVRLNVSTPSSDTSNPTGPDRRGEVLVAGVEGFVAGVEGLLDTEVCVLAFFFVFEETTCFFLVMTSVLNVVACWEQKYFLIGPLIFNLQDVQIGFWHGSYMHLGRSMVT